MQIKDRVEAGKKLAKLLTEYQGQDVIVYALPRGGVVVGAGIARSLDAPLDLVITRKIGHPAQPEYAIAAVAENGHMETNLQELSVVDKSWLKEAIERERQEAARRKSVYLSGQKSLSASGKVAILVDDGVATGLTMKVAVKEIKHQHPAKTIIAVPVIPSKIAKELEPQIDELVALEITDQFMGAIGAYYQDFPEVSDEEVIQLLKKHHNQLS